ncbi:MAG: radical SAM protein [Acidobacteria bacterium]|nr:radical SAM protein [Acidobacteriota bacterium]
MDQVASARKVAYHTERLASYLGGEPVFPVTLELDITSHCTRVCEHCPSSRSEYQHSLSFPFIEELLASLEGQTRGLLLSGGEPTMSPHFPAVLALARDRGFEDIAVVTNGSLLHKREVAQALAEHASTIRVSIYDWDRGSCRAIDDTLLRVEGLRKYIDVEEAMVKIGISALTSSDRASRLCDLTRRVRSSGAHWIYFHPMCDGWEDGNVARMDQTGVPAVLRSLVLSSTQEFGVHYLEARYDNIRPDFSGYHAAHFLMVVGADGKNYLGAEVKYQDRFAIADVLGKMKPGFLQDPDRLSRIASVRGAEYTAAAGLHRGVLYSHHIEQLLRSPESSVESLLGAGSNHFSFPHIL